jgi:hypothetical protein
MTEIFHRVSSNHPTPLTERTIPKNLIVLRPDQVPTEIEQLTNSSI